MAADDWPAGDPELSLADRPAVAVPSRSSCSRGLWNSVSGDSLPLVDWEVFALANDCPASPFAMAADLATGEVLPETLYDGGRPFETECTDMLFLPGCHPATNSPAAISCAPGGKDLPPPWQTTATIQLYSKCIVSRALAHHKSCVCRTRPTAVKLVTPPHSCGGVCYFKRQCWG